MLKHIKTYIKDNASCVNINSSTHKDLMNNMNEKSVENFKLHRQIASGTN